MENLNLEFFFAYSQPNQTVFTKFVAFSDQEGLPFPIYLSEPSKLLLTSLIVLVLLYGVKLRLQIVSYLRADDTKLGRLDYLIWMDQINGAFHGLSSLIRLVLLNSKVPMSSILGDSFCQWIDWPSCIYLIGSVTWSLFIALYRVLYILAQVFY